MDLNAGTQFPVMYKNNLCFIESKILKVISKINFSEQNHVLQLDCNNRREYTRAN